MLRYAGHKLFKRLLAIATPYTRRRRMRRLALLDLRAGDRVLDLGGTCSIWQYVETPLDVTIVNLPGVDKQVLPDSHHRFHLVVGDATDMPEYRDNQFDVVFSNSVIEHVGGEERRAAFAREVRRLAPRYFVQTPSVWFPLEAHTGIPFWWALPQSVRRRAIERWRAKLPAWTEMVEGTTVIARDQLQAYFPDGAIITERVMGIPKSYAAYRLGGNRAGRQAAQ